MARSTGADCWLLRPAPNPGALLRLFCFPYAGGSASIYRSWPASLPPEVELCAVQLPGRERRLGEAAFTRLTLLVPALAGALRPYMDLPFAFFGHSMGALIAFELARHLAGNRETVPRQLIVSGSRAPQLPSLRPAIHALPDDEFLSELRQLNGTPEEILQNPEIMQLLLPGLRADFAIGETYLYSEQPLLDCSISAYAGLDDGEVNWVEVALWWEQTAGSFRLCLFPGDHFFLQSSRELVLAALAEDLIAQLETRGS